MMTKEKVLNIFKEVLHKSGCEELISLSENVNELADIMIYQEYGENQPEYLAVNGIPLFPISEIKTILYRYGEGEDYNYVGSVLKFVMELKRNVQYILEYGDNGIAEAMCVDGKWAGDKEVRDALVQYNQISMKRRDFRLLLRSTYADLEDYEMIGIREALDGYIDENPEDEDTLLEYAYRALDMLVYEEKDLLNPKSIIQTIVQRKLEDRLIHYIGEEGSLPDPEDNGYYVGLVLPALRFIREIKQEEIAK